MTPPEQITVETIITDGTHPFEAIRPRIESRVEERTSKLVRLLLIHDDRKPFVLGAWPTAHEGVFHLVSTIPTTDARWRTIERWIAKAAPAVVPCLLNHQDFIDIGTALAEFGDVEVSRLTARKRSDQSSLNRGWPARAGSRRPSHQEAIADAEQEGANVRTLSLHIDYAISLHLRRVAGATYYSGQFNIFEDVVLRSLASAAARRRRLLSNRERTTGDPTLKPITIRLPSAVFSDAEATGAVLHVLEHLTQTAVAVMHRNPYLHVIVTDSIDGSNFDVFVTRPDAIDVYPGFRASLGALARVTQPLSERFGALEIVEAPSRRQVSLDDLIALR